MNGTAAIMDSSLACDGMGRNHILSWIWWWRGEEERESGVYLPDPDVLGIGGMPKLSVYIVGAAVSGESFVVDPLCVVSVSAFFLSWFLCI